MRVEIKNFQALAHVAFDIEGFTALVGRSNIGKSAVVRALKCALMGAEGTDFVRHDPKTCARVLKGNQKCKCYSSVKITTDDWTLLWEKGDSKNQYTTWVDGEKQEYTRVGKSPDMPPVLQGFEAVRIGDRSQELVQISDQFTPIFLLNVTGTAVADLLSDVAQLDDINKAMRLVTKDRKDASSTRKVREKDILTLETGLKAYSKLDDTAARVERTESLYETVEAKAESVSQVVEYLTWASDMTKSLKALKEATKAELPDADTLSSRGRRLRKVAAYSEDLEGKARIIKALDLATEKKLPVAQPLVALKDNLTLSAKYLQSLQEKARVIKSLRGVDTVVIPEPAGITDRVAQLKSTETLLRRVVALKEALTAFKGFDSLVVPSQPEMLSLLDQLKGLEGYSERLDNLQATVTSVGQELAEASEEEASVLEEFEALGVCPTCTQSVGPGHRGRHA